MGSVKVWMYFEKHLGTVCDKSFQQHIMLEKRYVRLGGILAEDALLNRPGLPVTVALTSPHACQPPGERMVCHMFPLSTTLITCRSFPMLAQATVLKFIPGLPVTVALTSPHACQPPGERMVCHMFPLSLH